MKSFQRNFLSRWNLKRSRLTTWTVQWTHFFEMNLFWSCRAFDIFNWMKNIFHPETSLTKRNIINLTKGVKSLEIFSFTFLNLLNQITTHIEHKKRCDVLQKRRIFMICLLSRHWHVDLWFTFLLPPQLHQKFPSAFKKKIFYLFSYFPKRKLKIVVKIVKCFFFRLDNVKI